MSTSVWSGPAEVVLATTVTTFQQGPLWVPIAWIGGTTAIVVRFAADAERAGPRVEQLQTIDGWVFELVNFDGDGRGTLKPGLLAEHDTHLLFWNFRVFRYGKSEEWTVHLTFYQVEKIAVGWATSAPDAG